MIFDFIINLWKKFKAGDFIKKFLVGGVTDDLKKYGTIAVTGLERIREGLDSPGVKQITDALPGDWDLKIVDAIGGAIDKVIPKISQQNDCFTKGTSLEIFRCTLAVIDSKPRTERTIFFQNLAFQIGEELFNTFVGKRFNLNALLMLIPVIYTQLFGKKDAELKPLD
jgi:hypothetical protein